LRLDIQNARKNFFFEKEKEITNSNLFFITKIKVFFLGDEEKFCFA